MSGIVTFDFSGATILVTGGTSGIGYSIASGFADAGADVIVTGTRSDATAYEVDLDRFGYRQLQITDPASIDGLVASLDRLDVLVNNAGANLPGGLDEWSADGFAASVDINLVGPMRLTTALRRLLFASALPDGASVINVSSMTAYRATTMVPVSATRVPTGCFVRVARTSFMGRSMSTFTGAPSPLPSLRRIKPSPAVACPPASAKEPLKKMGSMDTMSPAAKGMASAGTQR